MSLCLWLVLCASSCGLEDYPYLYPASGVSQASGTTLDFSHNTENNSASCFLGYEVYYRIYDGTASSASAVASTDGAYIESSWDSVTPDVILARLKAKGYVRLLHLDDLDGADTVLVLAPAPFVHVLNTTTSAYVEFNLTSSGAASITMNGGTPTSFTVRRTAKNSAGEYRNFGDFTKGDDCNFDATGIGAGQVANYAWVRAYVFAYGLDSSSFDTVVSKPSLLTYGAIALTKGASDN